MNRHHPRMRRATPLLAGLLLGLLGFLLTVALAGAAPVAEAEPTPAAAPAEATDVQACQECHLDVANRWSQSPHAQAFDAAHFQERWSGLGAPDQCLACHTTGFDAGSGTFAVGGVQCHACHGEAGENHPPAPVAIKADTEFCGACHTTTLSEWRLGAHAAAGIGCSDCHDPHSQAALFTEPDELCLNCHAETLGDHADDIHIAEGIGCVDCHALVMPPAEPPDDGIVPTGHSFAITATTCVACHTDALHAGEALPATTSDTAPPAPTTEAGAESETISAEQRVQTLEAALASHNTGLLFQGAVVGLVLGGSTAWLIGQNLRRRENDDER